MDGVILEGNSALNESALTGESIPVDKAEGDSVSAGTLNQSGFLKCRGNQSRRMTQHYPRLFRWSAMRQRTKAPIAKVADRVSGVFVPAVITIAAVTIDCMASGRSRLWFCFGAWYFRTGYQLSVCT